MRVDRAEHRAEIGAERVGHADRRLRQGDIGAAGQDRRIETRDVLEQDPRREQRQVPTGMIRAQLGHHRTRHLREMVERQAYSLGISGRPRGKRDPRGTFGQRCGGAHFSLGGERKPALRIPHQRDRPADQRRRAGVVECGFDLCRREECRQRDGWNARFDECEVQEAFRYAVIDARRDRAAYFELGRQKGRQSRYRVGQRGPCHRLCAVECQPVGSFFRVAQDRRPKIAHENVLRIEFRWSFSRHSATSPAHSIGSES